MKRYSTILMDIDGTFLDSNNEISRNKKNQIKDPINNRLMDKIDDQRMPADEFNRGKYGMQLLYSCGKQGFLL